MNPVAVVQEPAPRELARVFDHGIGRPDVESHDLLQPTGERAVQLSDVSDSVGWRFVDEGHLQSN